MSGPSPYAMSALGIPMDALPPSAAPPVVVLYGPPGVGKSKEAADTFPNNLYVQSQSDVLRYAEHFARASPQLMPYIPMHRVTVDERYANQFFQGSILNALNAILGVYVRAALSGTCPYDGITFDEWNTLCKRVYDEMDRTERGLAAQQGRKYNVFNVMGVFKAWHLQVLALGRLTGLNMVFVSHPQYPRFFDADDRRVGQVKTPGGPRMPQGVADQLNELCQEASAVIEMTVIDPPRKSPVLPPLPGLPPIPGVPQAPGALPAPPAASQPPDAAAAAAAAAKAEAEQDALQEAHRVTDAAAPRIFRTALTPEWFRKLRAVGMAAEIPTDGGKMGLRQILTQAGYRVGEYRKA